MSGKKSRQKIKRIPEDLEIHNLFKREYNSEGEFYQALSQTNKFKNDKKLRERVEDFKNSEAIFNKKICWEVIHGGSSVINITLGEGPEYERDVEKLHIANTVAKIKGKIPGLEFDWKTSSLIFPKATEEQKKKPIWASRAGAWLGVDQYTNQIEAFIQHFTQPESRKTLATAAGIQRKPSVIQQIVKRIGIKNYATGTKGDIDNVITGAFDLMFKDVNGEYVIIDVKSPMLDRIATNSKGDVFTTEHPTKSGKTPLVSKYGVGYDKFGSTSDNRITKFPASYAAQLDVYREMFGANQTLLAVNFITNEDIIVNNKGEVDYKNEKIVKPANDQTRIYFAGNPHTPEESRKTVETLKNIHKTIISTASLKVGVEDLFKIEKLGKKMAKQNPHETNKSNVFDTLYAELHGENVGKTQIVTIKKLNRQKFKPSKHI